MFWATAARKNCSRTNFNLRRRTRRDHRIGAFDDGLVEITGKSVSIVTNMAVAAQDIDETKAEEARQRTAARLREKLSSEEVASVNAALVRSLAQLRVKRRHRN